MSDGRVIDRLWRPSGRERDRLATHQPSRLPPHRGEQGGSFLFCPLLPAAARPSLSLPLREGTCFLSVSNTTALTSPPSQGGARGVFLILPAAPCRCKTLPVPPFEGGDLVSVGQQHISPRVCPLAGGKKGGLSYSAHCALPLQDPPCPSL